MLEDDEDDDYVEEPSSAMKRRRRELEEQLNLEHTKRRRSINDKQSKIKVSKEIYTTLHTMGQYLTNNEEKGLTALPIKKPVNSAKAQLIEQLASTVKVQEIELPPIQRREENLTSTTQVNQQEKNSEVIKREIIGTPKDNPIFKQKSRQEINSSRMQNGSMVQSANRKEEMPNRDYNAEMEKKVQMSYQNTYNKRINNRPIAPDRQTEFKQEQRAMPVEEFKEHKIKQQEIDHIVEGFFQGRVPQYAFNKDLKQHIDEQIRGIEQS